MKLSTEEKNLLDLFAGFVCAAEHECDIDAGCEVLIPVVDQFVLAFDADPRTYRQEIAPARELHPETEEEAHGGPR